jgi:SagB-type dehydrogenase family enzyme
MDAREYHERTNHTPERLRQDTFRLDHANRPRPYKIYEDLPRVEAADPDPSATPALDAVDVADADPPAHCPTPAGDPHLPTLCHYAAGVTKTLERQGQTVSFRAAACTGKLYHVDLYAVTGDCSGFDPGVYHFDPHTGGFDVLREGDFRGVLARAAGEREDSATGSDATGVAEAPVTFVAASEWWRNAWKYRVRTYRHAFWDAGTVLANLLAVAHGGGHRAEVLAGFADDPVVELLGVDPDEEAPVALVPVGTGAPAPDAPAVEAIDPDERPLSDSSVEYPTVPDAWRQSRLADGQAASAWRDRLAAESADTSLGRSRPGDGGDRIPTGPVDRETASARPVGATVERRGSLREYGHDPITAAQFGTVLDRALGGVPVTAYADADLRGLVDYYCLVHAVDGVESGVYEYHPGPGELEWVRDTDRETAGHLALDQSVVGDAR